MKITNYIVDEEGKTLREDCMRLYREAEALQKIFDEKYRAAQIIKRKSLEEQFGKYFADKGFQINRQYYKANLMLRAEYSREAYELRALNTYSPNFYNANSYKMITIEIKPRNDLIDIKKSTKLNQRNYFEEINMLVDKAKLNEMKTEIGLIIENLKMDIKALDATEMLYFVNGKLFDNFEEIIDYLPD